MYLQAMVVVVASLLLLFSMGRDLQSQLQLQI